MHEGWLCVESARRALLILNAFEYVPPAVLYTPPIIKNQLGKLLQQIFPECVTKPYYIQARLLTYF